MLLPLGPQEVAQKRYFANLIIKLDVNRKRSLKQSFFDTYTTRKVKHALRGLFAIAELLVMTLHCHACSLRSDYN